MELLPKSVKSESGFIVKCTKCDSTFICQGEDPAIRIFYDMAGYEAILTCPACHHTSGPLPPVPNYR